MVKSKSAPRPLPTIAVRARAWIDAQMPALVPALLPALRVFQEQLTFGVLVRFSSVCPLHYEETQPLAWHFKYSGLPVDILRELQKVLGDLDTRWEQFYREFPSEQRRVLSSLWFHMCVGAGRSKDDELILSSPELSWGMSTRYRDNRRSHSDADRAALAPTWQIDLDTGQWFVIEETQICPAATQQLRREMSFSRRLSENALKASRSPPDATGYWRPGRRHPWLKNDWAKSRNKPAYLPAGMPCFVELGAPPIKRLRYVADEIAKQALRLWPGSQPWPDAGTPLNLWDGAIDAYELPSEVSLWLSKIMTTHMKAIHCLRERTASCGHGWYLPETAQIRLSRNRDNQRTVRVDYVFGAYCCLSRIIVNC